MSNGGEAQSSATRRALQIIPQVPRIMRAQGWELAGHFMETWLDGAAHDFASYSAAPHERHAYLTAIRMDWVLSFPRARAVFDRLFVDGPLANPDVWQHLYAALVRRYRNKTDGEFRLIRDHPRDIEREGHVIAQAAAGTRLRQNNPGLAEWRTPEVRLPRIDVRIPDRIPGIGGRRVTGGGQRLVPSVGVGSGLDQASQLTTVDAMAGALARFTFCVVPDGTVSWRNGRIAKIAVRTLGVYVRDSFDFVGRSQPLGAWRAQPPATSPVPMNLSNALPGADWVWLTNGSFQDYRTQTGKGMDFIAYSDIRRVQLASPIEVTFQA